MFVCAKNIRGKEFSVRAAAAAAFVETTQSRL